MAEGVYRYGVNNDRWCYTIWVRDARGQRRKQWVRGFGTEREALRARRAALTALDRGEYVAPSTLTVGEFLTDYWLPAVRDDVRPSTLDS